MTTLADRTISIERLVISCLLTALATGVIMTVTSAKTSDFDAGALKRTVESNTQAISSNAQSIAALSEGLTNLRVDLAGTRAELQANKEILVSEMRLLRAELSRTAPAQPAVPGGVR